MHSITVESMTKRYGRVVAVDDVSPSRVSPGTATGSGAGHGLTGMRERVALLGGELETGRAAGGGFRVAVKLPL